MIELTFVAVSAMVLFVVLFFLIYGLRDAILDLRTNQEALIQDAVRMEVSQLAGQTAMISTSWDIEKKAVVFHIENVGEQVMEVHSFKFFDEIFTPLGEVLNDYPPMSPGMSLNFSIEVLNHEGLDNLRVLVTLKTDERSEDFLVRVPLIEETQYDTTKSD